MWDDVSLDGLMNDPQLQNMMNGADLGSMGDMDMIMSWFATAGATMNTFALLFFLLRAWGLWNINKKLWEPYPWLAWIPLLQVYSFVKAGGKKAIWILWIVLWFIAFIIPWIILVINVMHNTSKRTGRWIWTTLGFIFFGFIMYPVVWYKLKQSDIQNKATKNKQDWEKEERSEEL